MTLRVHIIGAGRRGRAHANALATLGDRAEIVAIADADETRAAALATELAPRAAIGRDALALLQESKPDIVYVTTPPAVHREQTIAAIELGADVVLEKPIALDIEDAEAIRDAAATAGRLVHVCHQLRYLPGVPELRDHLAEGPVAVTHIWNYRKAPDIPGNWSRSWGGGHVVEWGIHFLDLCRYLMGTEAVEVSAAYADQVLHGQPDWDNWDAYALTVRWENGAVGGYTSTYALPPGIPAESGLAIVAAGGKASLGWGGCDWTTADGTKTWSAEPGIGERALAAAFVRAVESGDASGLRQSFDDALRTHRLVMAANESAIGHRPVLLSAAAAAAGAG